MEEISFDVRASERLRRINFNISARHRALSERQVLHARERNGRPWMLRERGLK